MDSNNNNSSTSNQNNDINNIINYFNMSTIDLMETQEDTSIHQEPESQSLPFQKLKLSAVWK